MVKQFFPFSFFPKLIGHFLVTLYRFLKESVQSLKLN